MARSFLPNGLCPWPTPSSGPLPSALTSGPARGRPSPPRRSPKRRLPSTNWAFLDGLHPLGEDVCGWPRLPLHNQVQGPAKGLQLSQLPDPQLRSELRDHDREEVAGRHWRRRSPLAARCSAPPSRASSVRIFCRRRADSRPGRSTPEAAAAGRETRRLREKTSLMKTRLLPGPPSPPPRRALGQHGGPGRGTGSSFSSSFSFSLAPHSGPRTGASPGSLTLTRHYSARQG